MPSIEEIDQMPEDTKEEFEKKIEAMSDELQRLHNKFASLKKTIDEKPNAL